MNEKLDKEDDEQAVENKIQKLTGHITTIMFAVLWVSLFGSAIIYFVYRFNVWLWC